MNVKTDSIIVKSFQLISISLVDSPADVFGKFVTQNTIFEGFEKTEPVKENQIKNELEIFGI